MFRKKQVRQLLEARVNEAADPRRGRRVFVEELRDTLGLGQESDGRPTLGEHAAKPEEFSLRLLAEAICGDDFVDNYFNPAGGADSVTLLENAPGIDPTAFLNISTFNATVAALVEAKIIERFQNPALVGDHLVTTVPTRKNGDRFIGVTGIGDKSQTRAPGQPHPEAGFGENWVDTPETVEKALAIKVTQEAVFFDLTNQVLDVAGSVGDELAYRRELDILNAVIGATNPYKYNGTSYNTYQTASPWINDQSNQLADYTQIDAAMQLFVNMTDPATGKEILVVPRAVLVAPAKRALTEHVLNGMTVYEGTNLSGGFPGRQTIGVNPINRIAPQLAANVYSSPIAYNRCKAADGLNLSTANAQLYWWIGDFKRAFLWMENWPLRVRQASPTDYVMMDRGLIAAYFANYRGVTAVREPRYVVRNKN